MTFGSYNLSRIFKTSVIIRLRSAANTAFRKHLLVTNISISIALSGVGDTIEQHYEILNNDHERWDKLRTFQMSISGLTTGLICHNTYKYLDYFYPGKTVKNVFKKVLIDQIIVSPICIGIFFMTLAILEQSSFETFISECIHKGKLIYIAELVVWPPAQLFNFFFLPPRFRVLYDNTISVGFDIYSSRVKHDIPLPNSKMQTQSKNTDLDK